MSEKNCGNCYLRPNCLKGTHCYDVCSEWSAEPANTIIADKGETMSEELKTSIITKFKARTRFKNLVGSVEKCLDEIWPEIKNTLAEKDKEIERLKEKLNVYASCFVISHNCPNYHKI